MFGMALLYSLILIFVLFLVIRVLLFALFNSLSLRPFTFLGFLMSFLRFPGVRFLSQMLPRLFFLLLVFFLTLVFLHLLHLFFLAHLILGFLNILGLGLQLFQLIVLLLLSQDLPELLLFLINLKV